MEGKINKPLRLTFQDFNFFNFCIRNPLVSLCLFDVRAVHWWLSLVAEVYRLTYAEVCHGEYICQTMVSKEWKIQRKIRKVKMNS